MAILTVGPNSTFQSIADAMVAAGPNDTVILETGYSNEIATVTHSGMTFSGDVTSIGIVLQLATGIAVFTLAGTAPINVLDAADGNGIVGNDGDNVITVTNGVDAVTGGWGIDRLIVDYHLAAGAVTGDSTSNFTEAGGLRSVTITNGTFEHFTVLTGGGADTITTGSGDDYINAGNGANTITAGQGANTIFGGINADTITALDGGNFIDGGDGTNIITSGAGNDTILSGVGADTIVAGGGVDVITVLGGADTVNSGAGDDRLIVDYSVFTTDVIGGVTGGNLSTGYTGHLADTTVNMVDFTETENFTVTTGSGNDVITTGDGSDVLAGGVGNDGLWSGGGVDVLNGGAGNDTLDGGAGADEMRGGGDNDAYFVDDAGDQVIENANEGTDTVYATTHYQLGTNLENLVLQGTADLQGYGNALVNSLYGNSGNNLLDGGAGANSMAGGVGNDAYFVENAGDTITENANEGTDTVYSTAHLRLGANVENLVLQGTTDLQGYGNSLSNAIYGNSGNNILDGDVGVDFMVGGAGNDAYFVDNAGDSLLENANEGTDTVYSTAHLRLTANIENLVLQGTADLQGYGNGLSNAIYGNSGSNLLDGDVGADSMYGGAGNDAYFIDDSGDVVVENANEGSDTVYSNVDYGLTPNVENLILQGTADLQGYGNGQANSLYGNSGSNILNGGVGADAMYGGAGNDTYFVDDAGDVVVENANEGNDTVFTNVDYALTPNVENLVLQGGANLQGYGNGQANMLYGNSGDNLLNGGAGANSLSGNAGNDTFVFNATQADGDTVADFNGNGAAAGDSFLFEGFGTAAQGATFTQIGATMQWQIHSGLDNHNEVVTLSNNASVHPSDYGFM